MYFCHIQNMTYIKGTDESEDCYETICAVGTVGVVKLRIR